MRYYRSALGAEPRDPVLARDAARWDEPVRVPTLAIYGERDGCIGPEVHASQAEHFLGDLRLRPVSGVGHWPHLEDPAGASRSCPSSVPERRRATAPAASGRLPAASAAVRPTPST